MTENQTEQKISVSVTHKLELPEGMELEAEDDLVDNAFVQWDENIHQQRIDEFFQIHQDRITFGIIIGDKGSGKTAFVYRILELYEGQLHKDIYIYKPPNPEVIYFLNKKYGTKFKILSNVQDLLRISNAIVYIDEPQLTVAGGDLRTFINLVTISRHRDISIWASSVNTRFFTIELEALADCLIIKDCDPRLIKRGSLAQSIIKEYSPVDWKAFRLAKDEFVYYSRRYDVFNGRWQNTLPSFWCQELSKPYMLEHRAVRVEPNVKKLIHPDYLTR